LARNIGTANTRLEQTTRLAQTTRLEQTTRTRRKTRERREEGMIVLLDTTSLRLLLLVADVTSAILMRLADVFLSLRIEGWKATWSGASAVDMSWKEG
jgi:hypothetical protein